VGAAGYGSCDRAPRFITKTCRLDKSAAADTVFTVIYGIVHGGAQLYSQMTVSNCHGILRSLDGMNYLFNCVGG